MADGGAGGTCRAGHRDTLTVDGEGGTGMRASGIGGERKGSAAHLCGNQQDAETICKVSQCSIVNLKNSCVVAFSANPMCDTFYICKNLSTDLSHDQIGSPLCSGSD